jgi:hypothetical protein
MTIESEIQKTICRLPDVEGPIPFTESSYPFCAMSHSRTPLRLEAYGYIEEEFFLSGKANVYDADANDDLTLVHAELPYKNRILVRRPADKARFSGRVYVDILNATQGYDIEDLWHRIYLWCMENGHAYVGITSKPINVRSLKNFDYARYNSLNWASAERAPEPTISRSATIPGTEEGLVWDIISQVGATLRQKNGSNCMGGYPVQEIYLCGQSQSGAYLNTYVSYFDRWLQAADGKHLFDGYMNIVGALVQRSLRQENTTGPLKLHKRHMHPCLTPYIALSSEADLTLFSMFLDGEKLLNIQVENTDTATAKCRYYEIAGTPHTDIVCPVLTSLEDISRTGSAIPNLDEKLLENLNDYPTQLFICGLLNLLHIWACGGKAPEVFPPLERGDDGLLRDELGNAKGGLRTPLVDVPIASYTACNPDDPEGICGRMLYLTRKDFLHRYGSEENYLRLFDEKVNQQLAEGWLTSSGAKYLKGWAKKATAKLR